MVRRLRGRSHWSALAVLGLAVTACTQAPPPAPPSHVPSAEAAYLPSPLAGYPPTVDRERSEGLRRAHEGLDRDPAAAWAVAEDLLAEDADFHPASVLSAQVQLLRGEDRAVLETLAPVVEAIPAYLAGQLVRGRAAERLGEGLTAFRAFHKIAGLSELAERRAAELQPQAVEELLGEVTATLDRGQVEPVEPLLGELVQWLGGDDARMLEIELRLAVLADDLEQELELIRRLLAASSGAEQEAGAPELEVGTRRWDLLLRQAALELEVGDVRQGLDLYERLAVVDPQHTEVREGLGRAKFFWRLQLLPVRVQELGRKAELDRADLATILYWVVPAVRYTRVDNPPIANDILDHPERDEIVRVAGLGLMRVDRTLHRFEPGRPATRSATLLALLRVLEMAEQPVACLGKGEAQALRSTSLVCQAAARCRLIPEAGDCRPGAAVSGSEARELFRRGLELLGSE